jgi:8-oxo-dGTP pyrophosphatase MutT (NUDIX family)
VTSADAIDIDPIRRADIAVERWSWPFATERREDIDLHFASREQAGQQIWNGRVMLLNRYAVENGVLHGSCFETDYASFLAWREWGFPDREVFNVFAVAALQGADGGYVLGEMASSTANAGMVYFPCGTPDQKDVAADGTLDLTGSVGRELREETGLDIGALDAEPGWTLVHDRGYLAVVKRVAAAETAQALRTRILRHVSVEAQPEFSDVHIIARGDDLKANMPCWAVAYLEHVWRRQQAGAVHR